MAYSIQHCPRVLSPCFTISQQPSFDYCVILYSDKESMTNASGSNGESTIPIVPP